MVAGVGGLLGSWGSRNQLLGDRSLRWRAASLYFSAAVSGNGLQLWISRAFLTRGLWGFVASVNLCIQMLQRWWCEQMSLRASLSASFSQGLTVQHGLRSLIWTSVRTSLERDRIFASFFLHSPMNFFPTAGKIYHDIRNCLFSVLMQIPIFFHH